jgi:hypothetical protein
MSHRASESEDASSAPGAPGALFEEILFAPDRDHCPGARPVVSYRNDDERRFLEQIRRHARLQLKLERRGVFHGRWAELDAQRLLPQVPGRRKLEAIWNVRWLAAQPIALPGLLAEELPRLRESLRDAQRLHESLREPVGLRRWLAGRVGELKPAFGFSPDPLPLADPERDLERLAIRSLAPGQPEELWIKTSRLSTFPDERSLRMRFSFGGEGDDDASHDEALHARVGELAERLLPEARAIARHERLNELLRRFCAGPVRFTQHIAYWNAPQGGASFHHDAFDEDFAHRQRGVCYAQLSGVTAWLALSIEDLAERVGEFVEALQEGEMPWVREELFPARDDFARIRVLTRQRHALLRELALPDCGSLRTLVNRGPEFTSLLADAGHAVVLHPGDVLLLPNQGLARTAMHSVFSGSDKPGYALSLAIRAQAIDFSVLPRPSDSPDTPPDPQTPAS